MPKVSFILPAYKRRFLREAIASILAQTYRDFELVVVDDCSPEDLKSVVDEFNDERLSYHRNATNIGGKDLVAAWNKAMEYANGEWCVLASDDDVYDTNYLFEMVRLSEKYPTSDLFHCRLVGIDEKGEWTCMSEPRLEYETQIQMVYYRGGLWNFQVAPDFMFRHKVFVEVGGFVNFPCAWYTDDAMWMLLAKNGVGYSGRVMFQHRGFEESLSCRLDNVMEKLRASEMFKIWFKTFITKLEPKTDEDRFILRDLWMSAETRVDNLTAASFLRIPLRSFLSVALNRKYSAHLRRTLWYARFPKLVSIRRLIPIRSRLVN